VLIVQRCIRCIGHIEFGLDLGIALDDKKRPFVLSFEPLVGCNR